MFEELDEELVQEPGRLRLQEKEQETIPSPFTRTLYNYGQNKYWLGVTHGLAFGATISIAVLFLGRQLRLWRL